MRVYDLSAQMAYYFLMSVFPFLFVIYSLLAFLPVNQNTLLQLVQPYAPVETFELITETLKYTTSHSSSNFLSFSLIATLWLSSMGFQCMKRILDDAYEVQSDESVLKQIALGLLLTLGFMIAVLFSVIIPFFEKFIRSYLTNVFDIPNFYLLWTGVQWGIGSIFLFSFFIALYYFSPSINLTLRQVMPGAIFSMIGWQLVSFGFAAYVSDNNYDAFYGQLGGIVVLMLWFYLSAMVIILGGIINAIYLDNKNRK
jgi:membrane protein